MAAWSRLVTFVTEAVHAGGYSIAAGSGRLGGHVNFLNGWCHALRWQRLPEMERLGVFLFTHLDGIAAYCDHQVRFGVVESINTTIPRAMSCDFFIQRTCTHFGEDRFFITDPSRQRHPL